MNTKAPAFYEADAYLSLGTGIACGIMTVVSVILFFTLQIQKVVGDLTGRTARKAIEDIRRQNEQSGEKVYRSSAVNLRRGKVTDKISPSGRIEAKHTTPFGTGVITERISTQKLSTAQASADTMVLEDGNGTTVLTEVPDVTATACTETTVLQRQEQESDSSFAIEYEILFVHTSEVIS